MALPVFLIAASRSSALVVPVTTTIFLGTSMLTSWTPFVPQR